MDTGIQITRYSADMSGIWNTFVTKSKNGTFLFDRSFMEYHSDRFEDHSLVFFAGDNPVALLPANRRDDVLQSHGGLTYGGLVTGNKMTASLALDVFDGLASYLKANGFAEMFYKAIPHIYHQQPAEEDIYALFRNGAPLIASGVSSSIPIQSRLSFSGGKKDGLRKARKAGLEVRESLDWSSCWGLLTEVLEDRHAALPTHSEDEIRKLAGWFPNQIRLFGAFWKGEMVAALVIFDCGKVIHVQYMASSDAGRRHGGLDLIVSTLLDETFTDRDWLDFGISTTDQGNVLNEGLARQKEMFGARTVVYQQFMLSVK